MRRASDCAPYLSRAIAAIELLSIRLGTPKRVAANIESATICAWPASESVWQGQSILHALAELRYQFRAEAGSATEPKSRFVRRCASWMKNRFHSGSRPWRCWVVDDGRRLLGHVCVQLFEKHPNPVKNEPELHAYITNFYVIPEKRSQGFGRKLLDKALSWCRVQWHRRDHPLGDS